MKRVSGSARNWRLLLVIAGTLLGSNLWAAESSTDSDAMVTASIGGQSAGTPSLAGWKPPEMPKPTPFSNHKLDPEIAKTLKEQWGIELRGIRRTAAGIFMDFRFHVVDAEKALALFDTRVKPYVIAERSKIKLPVPMAPKVGAFRTTNRGKNIKAGKTYYIMFGNPDRHVQQGEMVTVVVGDFKVEHLIVN